MSRLAPWEFVLRAAPELDPDNLKRARREADVEALRRDRSLNGLVA